MTSRLAIVPLMLLAALIAAGPAGADEPATTPTTPTPSVPVHKPQATSTITGKVDKITPTSITLKVTLQTMTGGKVIPGHHVGGHTTPAHLSGGWFPHLVPGHSTKPHTTGARVTPGKVHTSVQTMTFNIGDEPPPVKIVTNGPKPTRETGSFADVRPGDLAYVGIGPVRTQNPDGKSTTRTLVTGLDVLHVAAATTSPKPKK